MLTLLRLLQRPCFLLCFGCESPDAAAAPWSWLVLKLWLLEHHWLLLLFEARLLAQFPLSVLDQLLLSLVEFLVQFAVLLLDTAIVVLEVLDQALQAFDQFLQFLNFVDLACQLFTEFVNGILHSV